MLDMKTKGAIGIIGLGLIGGSIAIALKGKRHIVGMSRNAQTVDYALSEGIIDEAAKSYSDFAKCDAVIVCTPLSIVKRTVTELYNALGDSVIISDVGSVKGMLSGLKGRIIGGHPMAGTEQNGIRAAKERLLENAFYILVDYSDKADNEDLKYMQELVRKCGAVDVVMSAEEHDKLVAKISHLEHIAAYSIVNSALTGDEEIVGSGFMDTTRIASSSPEFWNTVVNLNRANILTETDNYIKTLTDVRDMIEKGEDLTPFFRDAKNKRDGLSYIKRYRSSYVIYVDVSDCVGSIVSVLSMLADGNVSISNLTVMNSREGVGGALRIELKDEHDYKKAKEILAL